MTATNTLKNDTSIHIKQALGGGGNLLKMLDLGDSFVKCLLCHH